MSYNIYFYVLYIDFYNYIALDIWETFHPIYVSLTNLVGAATLPLGVLPRSSG